MDLAVPIVGFVLAYKRPANRIGWLFLIAGLAAGLGSFLNQYGLHALIATPGSLPGGRAFAWLSNWIWQIPIAVFAFVLLLFPTGRLRSPRWRPAAWFVGAAFTLSTAGFLANATHIWAHPFILFDQPGGPPDLIAALVLMILALLVSAAAVVVRFARSVGEERLQLKWFTAAAVLVVATQIPSFTTSLVLVNALNDLALLCLWVTAGLLSAYRAVHGPVLRNLPPALVFEGRM